MKRLLHYIFTLAVLLIGPAAIMPGNLSAVSEWREDPLLGWTWQTDTNWHYHPVHGWLWYASDDAAARTVYSSRWGWLWYAADTYPFTWSFDWRTWYSAEFTAVGEAWIYDHWADAWYAASDTPLERVQRRLPAIMRHAGGRLGDTAATLDPVADEFPNYTGINGGYSAWLTRPKTWWASGFFPASLWLQAVWTDSAADRETATRWTAPLFSEVNKSTYDIGFQIGLPFRRAFEVTQDSRYSDGMLDASAALDTRYNSFIGAVRHWTFRFFGDPGNFTVIIDSLMNMELLYWAGSRDGGTPAWGEHAEIHGLTLGNANVRDDGSTFHYTIFDESSGAIKQQGTWQGYADDSTWSRGQAWAIYGFAIAYRETGNSAFLDLSRKVTDFFLENLPEDGIPPSDFDDPAGLDAGKDSSAAAIAASGLWILASLDPDTERAEAYANAASELLLRLSHPDYLSTEIDSEAILLQGSPRYGDYRQGTVFGDYYFLEALLRWSGFIDQPE